MHRPARRNGSPQYVASLPYRLMVPAAPCLELRRTWQKEAGIANPEQYKMARTRRRVRRHVSRVLSPVAAVAAVLYFLIDAVFLSGVRTVIRSLERALW